MYAAGNANCDRRRPGKKKNREREDAGGQLVQGGALGGVGSRASVRAVASSAVYADPSAILVITLSSRKQSRVANNRSSLGWPPGRARARERRRAGARAYLAGLACSCANCVGGHACTRAAAPWWSSSGGAAPGGARGDRFPISSGEALRLRPARARARLGWARRGGSAKGSPVKRRQGRRRRQRPASPRSRRCPGRPPSPRQSCRRRPSAPWPRRP